MRDLEHREGVALTRWARMQVVIHPGLKWLHHIPNGGFRNKVTAGKLKAEGVKAGVADYFLPWPVYVPPGQRFAGLYIELKAPGSTYPTKDQKAFLADMQAAGYAATWCRGWEAARDAILAYLAGESIPFDWRDYGKKIHIG